MTANLTRDEARTRAELITVGSYQIELDLTGGDTTFRSVSTIAFDCARHGAGTFLNLTATARARDDSQRRPGSGQRVRRRPDQPRGARGRAQHGRGRCRVRVLAQGEGLHRFVDPVDGKVSVSRNSSVRREPHVLGFEQPDLKAQVRVTVSAPAEWTVVCNLAAETVGGTPTARGWPRWAFPPTPRMSTYITRASAGP